MSHDKNGTLIEVGDIVTLELEVKSISGDEDFCCLTAETTIAMPGNGLKNTVYALSTKQVLLVAKNCTTAALRDESDYGSADRVPTA